MGNQTIISSSLLHENGTVRKKDKGDKVEKSRLLLVLSVNQWLHDFFSSLKEHCESKLRLLLPECLFYSMENITPLTRIRLSFYPFPQEIGKNGEMQMRKSYI